MENAVLNKAKILVTGGAGFIGSNLCEALLNLGAEITCLDNFVTGKSQNIQHFLEHPNFNLIVGDIRNISDCRKATENIDYVLHNAALGSVPRSVNDPITTNDVNVSGFLNMLVASQDAQIKRFVYAASSSTYGDSKKLPKIENIIGKPLSPYAITKYVNELYADVFNKTYGLDTIGLRYFNVFGRKQDPYSGYAAVIPLFIKQLIKKEPLVINGNGENSRDFTYIDNVIQMNLLALTTRNKMSLNTVYNTAYGEQTTLNNLIHYLKEFLGEFDSTIKDVEVEYGSIRVGDITHSLASIEKAQKMLGYSPKYNIRDGLKESVKWYYENI